jgi:choline dehydrogenase
VLANRLSASGAYRVLLLEAGGEDRNPWIHIPIGCGKLFKDSKLNELYESEPEPELNNRRIVQPRGKVLGGSSSINGLVYIRGQKEDFDHWRQLGNVGWSFDDVLPYFRKAEDQQRDDDDVHARADRYASATNASRSSFATPSSPPQRCRFSAQRRFQRHEPEGAGHFRTTMRARPGAAAPR